MDDHDYFSDLFEWDDNGNKRRKRVMRHGDKVSFPMTLQDDAGGGFRATFADGSPDYTSPHRPGFRFADSNDPLRQAADKEYEDRKKRMSSAWKKRAPQPQRGRVNRGGAFPVPHAGDGSDGDHHDVDATPARTLDAAQLRALADGAYNDRCERLRNGWRNR